MAFICGTICRRIDMKIKDIATLIEKVAPLQLQESYDNAGLQVGDPEQEVTGIVTTLDVTERTVDLAIEKGANLIVSHHPLLFRATKQINPRRDYISRVIIKSIQHGVAIYSAHTNLDNTALGVNRRIAEVLGLTDIRPLAKLGPAQTAGLESDFVSQCGSGTIGELPAALSTKDFIALVKERFHIDALMGNADDVNMDRQIRTVALCGGAGDDFIPDAIRAHADVYLTGEVGYHFYFGHPELFILCGGHFETEQYTSQLLKEMILQQYPSATITVAPKSSPVRTF